ncbi:diguanylate cyclase [Anaerolineales bacterium HSG24]|nr:diguanylate cyclase [Anaerolineales bacterium HSG24]
MNIDIIHNSTILVVDDNPTNLKVLFSYFRSLGFTVTPVRSGEHAIRFFDQQSCDIILLDILMPDMNGYDTCQHLKANSATKDIPIIFMSALSETVNKVKGFEVGAVDYITKPFEYEEVLARVKTHLTLRFLQKYMERKNKQLQQEIAKRKQLEEELWQANNRLHYLAAIDGLTQVANRRSFDIYLNQQWQKMHQDKTPLSLIMCDIDYFKQYNDLYGHLAGDDCLQQVAQNIRQVVSPETDLVARYGGEEFAVILPNISLEQAYETAQSIQAKIAQLKIIHEQSAICPYLTVSMGISSMVPNQKSDPNLLIHISDKMLYQAKNMGRNRIIMQ